MYLCASYIGASAQEGATEGTRHEGEALRSWRMVGVGAKNGMRKGGILSERNANKEK